MFLISHVLGAFFLGLEGLMAYLAFSGLQNECNAKPPQYPCRVAKLFNENFVNIPFIG